MEREEAASCGGNGCGLRAGDRRLDFWAAAVVGPRLDGSPAAPRHAPGAKGHAVLSRSEFTR
jgi:hypothetical protein